MQFERGDKVLNDYKQGLNNIQTIDTANNNEAIKKFGLLIMSPEVTDIQIYGPDKVFVKVNGVYSQIGETIFNDDSELIALLNGLLSKSISNWKSIPDDPRSVIKDPSKAEIDTRMGDGSRISITLPPISEEITATIAKFKRKRMTMKDILVSGSLSSKMAEFLTWCVDSRLSILITGETGAGKTTLLQALAQRFGYERANETVIVIEDTPELLIESPYTNAIDYWRVVDNAEMGAEGGKMTLSDLVKMTLRRRMDRLVISEVRGEEAFYMVDANNTGTSGTLCTLHANSAREAVYRLQNLCLRSEAQGITLASIARDIGSAFQIIVHQTRDNRGRYIIKEIIEITAEESQNGPEIKFNPIFTYDIKKEEHVHVGIPTERILELAMQRAQKDCPKDFLKSDPAVWEQDFRK